MTPEEYDDASALIEASQVVAKRWPDRTATVELLERLADLVREGTT